MKGHLFSVRVQFKGGGALGFGAWGPRAQHSGTELVGLQAPGFFLALAFCFKASGINGLSP